MTDQQQQQVFRNKVINKKQLQKLVSWAFTEYGTARTARMADEVKDLGFKYATRAGVSISVDDLQIPPTKKAMLEAAEETIRATEDKYTRGEITEVERFQKVIDTWNATSENLKDEVVRNFKANNPLNSVYMMAFSGARGNVSQVRQLVGMRGLMANPQGEIIDLPIKTNFREGLTVTEYIISSYGARKGLVDTALRTADSGYLTRRLVDVSQDVIIREIDCGTERGVVVGDMTDGEKTLIPLRDRIFGRVAGEDVKHPETGEMLVQRNQDISADLADQIVASGVKEMMVRSPLTCEATRSVCQLCYGWSLAHAHLVDIGEAVGIIAAQSIGEPGTQLTMRTFHTGGVFTGEVARQEKAKHGGTVQFPPKIRTRAFRTTHGDDALIVESNDAANKITIAGSKNQTFTLPQGAMLFIQDGQEVQKGQILAEIPLTGRARKTTEKAAKDVATDLAGEVRFADVVPEEKKDRQGNTTRIAQRGGLMWVLSGDVYNLPPGAEPTVKNGDHVDEHGVIAETKITTENGGIVRLSETDSESKGGREVEIITASVQLDKAKVSRVESLQGGDQYRLETNSGQVFSLTATPGTQVVNGQVVAELIDDRYQTQTGGIVKYAGLEVGKRAKGKTGYEVIQGGTLIWIPEEAHEVNKDISLLMVEDGQFVEAGTEVVKDIFCQTSGVIEVTQKNDILREIVVKPGDLHMVDTLDGLITNEAALVNPGQEIKPGLTADELCYVEFVETPEGPAMLVRPIVEYSVDNSAPIPSQSSTSDDTSQGIELQASQRVLYKDGERVKSVDGVDLVRTQLVLSSDRDNLAANIELIEDDQDAEILRLQIVILESLVIRRDIAADTTQGSTRTEILVKDGDQIGPNDVVARTAILCKEEGEVQGIREGTEAIRRILVVRAADKLTVPTKSKSNAQVGDLVVASSGIDATEADFNESGEVLSVASDSVTMRIARPYRVSPGAVLHVDNGDLVQRGDNLVLLIFERTKTGDIIQGLPRIEELLEARKPKEACVLCQRAGTVQVAYAEDDSVEVKVVDDEGLLTEYPIGPGQSVIVIDGEQVEAGERLTDGPVNPHDLLEILFQAHLERLGTHESALYSLKVVQSILVAEVQAVYQSQGIDISDKHIEVVVRQMTSKVRVEDGGDTTMLPGELVELYQLEQVNEAMAITGGAPAHYTPVLLGITKASLNTDSFISAASFQETTRVLTEAAIEGKSDWLRGLKENVIIGRLIPAGTGFNAYEEIGAPEVDMNYDGMFTDDSNLNDIVLDDRTARNYKIDGVDERPTFSFESFGSGDAGADYGAAYKSPILDDDELIDDSIGSASPDDDETL